MPIPPEPLAWAEPAWRAWNELNSERSWLTVGMSMPMGATIIQSKPGYVPWRAVQEWCDRNRGNDRDFILACVSALDREFIAHWVRQQAKGQQQTPDDKLARWDKADD